MVIAKMPILENLDKHCSCVVVMEIVCIMELYSPALHCTGVNVSRLKVLSTFSGHFSHVQKPHNCQGTDLPHSLSINNSTQTHTLIHLEPDFQ